MPADPAALTVEKILRVREQFKPERYRFQALVSSIAETMKPLDGRADPGLAAEMLRAIYERDIRPAVEQLTDALNAQGVKTIVTAASASVTVPPILIGTGLPAPVVGLAAAVLTFVPILLDARRPAAAAYTQSQAARLCRVVQALAPRTLSQWVGKGVHTFLGT